MKNFYAAAFTALILVGIPASAQQSAEEPARDANGKITDKDHPQYIRCRTESVIGSRAKKRRVCLTNAEWARVGREGNSIANEMVENARSGMNGSN